MKVCETCGTEISTRDGENQCEKCADSETKKSRAKAQRRARHQVMSDLGLVRVRGAMGGVYYE